MGSRTGDYSANIFREDRRWVGALQQQGKPAVDALFNALWETQEANFRRYVQIMGDGSPNNGFLIAESISTNVNNFTIKGGDGTNFGAGRIWVAGRQCILLSDVEYNNLGATDAQDSIHAQSTLLTSTVITDSSANWNVDEFVGRELNPDITQGTTFTVISNTATTITTAGDMLTAGAAGARFRVDLSTPGGARTDVVYLDVYLDEISDADDPTINQTIQGQPIETMRPLQVIQKVQVRENSGVIPSNGFIDADGNEHSYLKIAIITRDTDADIQAAEISDERPTLGGQALENFDLLPTPDLLVNSGYEDGQAGVEADPTNGQLLVPGWVSNDLDSGTSEFEWQGATVNNSDFAIRIKTSVSPGNARVTSSGGVGNQHKALRGKEVTFSVDILAGSINNGAQLFISDGVGTTVVNIPAASLSTTAWTRHTVIHPVLSNSTALEVSVVCHDNATTSGEIFVDNARFLPGEYPSGIPFLPGGNQMIHPSELDGVSLDRSNAFLGTSGAAPTTARHYLLSGNTHQGYIDTSASAQAVDRLMLTDAAKQGLHDTAVVGSSDRFIVGILNIQNALDNTQGGAATAARYYLKGGDTVQNANDNATFGGGADRFCTVTTTLQGFMDSTDVAGGHTAFAGVSASQQDALDGASGPTGANPYATISQLLSGRSSGTATTTVDVSSTATFSLAHAVGSTPDIVVVGMDDNVVGQSAGSLGICLFGDGNDQLGLGVDIGNNQKTVEQSITVYRSGNNANQQNITVSTVDGTNVNYTRAIPAGSPTGSVDFRQIAL